MSIHGSTMPDDYVTIEDVEIGIDTDSGLAFHCKINDEWVFVPYSQVRARHNSKNQGCDSIEVARWLAEKNGWL